MPDRRTRAEKLAAMANQTASPREAEIARRMLARQPLALTMDDLHDVIFAQQSRVTSLYHRLRRTH